MAGGYKTWAFKEMMASSDVNNFLMSQVTPRFASTAARDAAIPAPEAGQICYVSGAGVMLVMGTDWELVIPSSHSATNLTLLNGWLVWGNGYETPRYRRIPGNRVELSGLVKAKASGTQANEIATLPAGL